MKSYLSLIPISAKVHRSRNRMTQCCIILAVFLVTAVFSIAEMVVRMETTRLQEKNALSLGDILSSSMGQSLLPVAAVLFVLVLIAGVLMISGSINSSVTQRTKFFGMMRCIGMSRRQIVRFVRLEALNWCKTAVPVGIGLGIVATWALCAVLRFAVGEEFSGIPLFGISLIGILSGAVVGIASVLIAAGSPAKRASKVAPVTAVSGNAEAAKNMKHGAKTRFGRIETALGMHHAASQKKNLLLMAGSFALSIILFLSFTVLIDFVDYVMPQFSDSPDITVSGTDGLNSVDAGLVPELRGMDGVKRVFGRRSSLDIPAEWDSPSVTQKTVDLVSYDDFDLDCLKKDDMLMRGSDLKKVYGDSGYVLATWDEDSPAEIGDRILVCGEELEIAGLLKYDPFSSDGRTNGKVTLITSDETFTRLTGEENYSLVLIQMKGNATDENVEVIRNLTELNYTFSDQRDQKTSGTYFAFVFCIYAFLAIIALVTALGIINSISMSVSARMRQYGVMRAVGMDERQVTKMIAAEALTYAVSGGIAGCAVGLFFNRQMFRFLIETHFSYAAWDFPVTSLCVILLFVFGAAAAAVYAPAKRIRDMSVTEAVNEL